MQSRALLPFVFVTSLIATLLWVTGQGRPPAVASDRPATTATEANLRVEAQVGRASLRPLRATTSCANTSCTGIWPEAADCDSNVTNVGTQIWAAAVQGTIEIRHSVNCNARWARIYWIHGDTCDLSALAIQQRTSVNGTWKYSSVQKVSKGFPVFCTSSRYWTRMVPGEPGQVRVRYAEGYMAPGCSTGCVRWRWYAWSSWRG